MLISLPSYLLPLLSIVVIFVVVIDLCIQSLLLLGSLFMKVEIRCDFRVREKKQGSSECWCL